MNFQNGSPLAARAVVTPSLFLKSLAMLALIGQTVAPPGPAAAQDLPTLNVTSLSDPIQTARRFTDAVAPSPSGGTYIAQFFNYGYGDPRFPRTPQWITLDLATGKQTLYDLPGYANSNFNISNQLRAANGRIFFSAMGNQIHYFDPTSGRIESLGALIPPQTGYQFFYRLEFGGDGMLYGTTQSNNGRAAVVQVNPETLAVRTWLDINPTRTERLTYGYYLSADPPWVYVTVGKGQWQLIALNIQTDEIRVLKGEGDWMSPGHNPAGVRVSIKMPVPAVPPDVQLPPAGQTRAEVNRLYSSSGFNEYWFCIEGALYPARVDGKPNELPERTTPYLRWTPPDATALPQIVEVTDPDATGQFAVQWRPAGAPDNAVREVIGKGIRVQPIGLESLTRLADGTLLGNAQQYRGFFRFNPKNDQLDTFPSHGPSGPIHVTHQGVHYFAGYPNSGLYSYDAGRPWQPATRGTTPPHDPSTNPRHLGYFGSTSGAHFAYFMISAENGRLYFGGRCERGITGTGVGWFDAATGTFHGHHKNLNFHTPRGMVVRESINRIVLSGELQNDPNATTAKPEESQFVVFDLDLNEIERLTLKPGLTITGRLFPAPKPDEFIGLINHPATKQFTLYRYNLTRKSIEQWIDLTTPVQTIFQRPEDQSWWTLDQDRVLSRLDMNTLAQTPVGKLGSALSRPTWVGDTLYGTTSSALVRVKP